MNNMENNYKQLFNEIINKIEKYEKVIIVRHIRPDGDCVGASLGLREILRDTYPLKEIYVIAKDFAENLNYLAKEDEEKPIDFYTDALCIAVDTGNLDRISNELYKKCNEIIKIDHHPNVEPYGNFNWVEDERSSVCEMIALFAKVMEERLVLSNKAAELLYMGIVTDSGRFKFSSATGDTMRIAGYLLDKKFDVETMYAHLYLKDFTSYKLESDVYKKMKISKNGVAYVYIPKSMQDKYGISSSEASLMVSSLDSIKGSLIWLAFIDNPDGTIRVRLRSRFLDINDIAIKYYGGGHGRASGATVYSVKELKCLVNDCDKKLKKFKSENNGWL